MCIPLSGPLKTSSDRVAEKPQRSVLREDAAEGFAVTRVRHCSMVFPLCLCAWNMEKSR